MTGRQVRLSAVLLLALGLALGACGRKGSLYAPEGEEDAYTGLGAYPAPASVVPDWDDPAAAPGGETVSEEERELERGSELGAGGEGAKIP